MPLNFRVRIIFYYGNTNISNIFMEVKSMSNFIQVTDNLSISEEKYRRMINIMKQFFDEIGDLGISFGVSKETININDLPNNEGLQAFALVFMNTFTEGAIESINQAALNDGYPGDQLNEEQMEYMRDKTRQVLSQVIFNRV